MGNWHSVDDLPLTKIKMIHADNPSGNSSNDSGIGEEEGEKKEFEDEEEEEEEEDEETEEKIKNEDEVTKQKRADTIKIYDGMDEEKLEGYAKNVDGIDSAAYAAGGGSSSKKKKVVGGSTLGFGIPTLKQAIDKYNKSERLTFNDKPNEDKSFQQDLFEVKKIDAQKVLQRFLKGLISDSKKYPALNIDKLKSDLKAVTPESVKGKEGEDKKDEKTGATPADKKEENTNVDADKSEGEKTADAEPATKKGESVVGGLGFGKGSKWYQKEYDTDMLGKSPSEFQKTVNAETLFAKDEENKKLWAIPESMPGSTPDAKGDKKDANAAPKGEAAAPKKAAAPETAAVPETNAAPEPAAAVGGDGDTSAETKEAAAPTKAEGKSDTGEAPAAKPEGETAKPEGEAGADKKNDGESDSCHRLFFKCNDLIDYKYYYYSNYDSKKLALKMNDTKSSEHKQALALLEAFYELLKDIKKKDTEEKSKEDDIKKNEKKDKKANKKKAKEEKKQKEKEADDAKKKGKEDKKAAEQKKKDNKTPETDKNEEAAPKKEEAAVEESPAATGGTNNKKTRKHKSLINKRKITRKK